jgi:phosphotransferase system IIA component
VKPVSAAMGPGPHTNHTINVKTPRAVLGMQGAAVACLPHQNPITTPLAPDVANVDSQRHAYLIDLLGHAELVIILVVIGSSEGHK